MLSPLFAFAYSIPFMLLFGLLKANQALLFTAGSLVFLVGAAWAFGTESVRHLTITRRFRPQAFERTEAELRVEIRNGSAFPLLGPHVLDHFLAQDMLAKDVVVPGDRRVSWCFPGPFLLRPWGLTAEPPFFLHALPTGRRREGA